MTSSEATPILANGLERRSTEIFGFYSTDGAQEHRCDARSMASGELANTPFLITRESASVHFLIQVHHYTKIYTSLCATLYLNKIYGH